MITNLEIVDDETAKAFGDKYDLAKALDAAESFLRRFAAMTALAAPGMPQFVRFGPDEERRLDDDAYRAIRTFYARTAERYDAMDASLTVIIGPFRVLLKLLGDDDLFLKEGEAEPRTISAGPWTDLTNEPRIIVMPAGGSNPLFELGSIDAVQALVRAAAPAGTDARAHPSLPGLRFPHAVFGAGSGTIRIALTRIRSEEPPPDEAPVEP